MTDDKRYKWIGGDGGPLIVLQTGAMAKWQGAKNFSNSLMRGGSIETDYDVICRCDCYGNALHRYERDMLILSESSFDACFVSSPLGEVVILQWLGWDDDAEALIHQLISSPPSRTFPLTIKDATLRLLVGAQDGTGGPYGYAEASITPGTKVGTVHSADEGLLVVLQPAI